MKISTVDQKREIQKKTFLDNLSEKYVLNPLFRMRNETDYVILKGWENSDPPFYLDHSIGITVALFNGERNINEIANITKPFVKNANNEEDAFQKSKAVVEGVLFFLSEEVFDTDRSPTPFDESPSDAALIPQSLLSSFRRIKQFSYDPEKLLPKFSYPKYEGVPGSNKLRAPYSIFWHLTSECATDCKYCYLGRRQISKSSMLSKKRVLEIIDEAHKMGVFYFVILGGDILLAPHLFDVLDKLAECQMLPLSLPTKAYVSKEFAKRLADYDNIWEIQFSMDSTVPEIADWMVQRPGWCRRTLESIDNALEAGINVSCKAVITPYNILTIPKLYRDLRKRGVKPIRLATYVRSGFHHTDDLYNHIESMEWLNNELDKLSEEFSRDRISLQNGPPSPEPLPKETMEEKWKNRSSCSAGRTTMMICSDGKVIPCEQIPETEQNFCGDISKQSLEEIWNSKELNERTILFPKEKYKGTACYNCDERSKCHLAMGYCIRDAAVHFGSIYKPSTTCPKSNMPFIRFT